MDGRLPAAIYSIIVGLGMIGIWVMLLVTGSDPQLEKELATIPFSIGMAIGSDCLTALVLFIAAAGLLTRQGWSNKALLLGLGFLFYSVINAAGLYGQRGDTGFTIMFGAIFLLGIVFAVLAFRSPDFDY